MSASLRDLSSRAEALRPPTFDTETLIRQAEVRAGRRRMVTLGATAIAVALIGVGVATFDKGEDHSAPPAQHDQDTDEDATGSLRQVVYGSGDDGLLWEPTTTIHYGSHTVDILTELSVQPEETQFVHLDATDDGVAFTIANETGAGAGVWFTDGTTTQRIGNIHGYLGLRNHMAVVTGTAGSRVAWIEEPKPGHAEIVVYDTRADGEEARVPAPACHEFRLATCVLEAVVGQDHVYFVVEEWTHRRPDVHLRLDVSTSKLERVGPEDLAADLASRSRGLVLGDSPDTGLVTNGYGVVFDVRGEQLVPMRQAANSTSTPTQAFDTGTHRPVLFRLPSGYDAPDQLTAFEWLDSDQLALMNGANGIQSANADILSCRISTGRCDVLASGNDSGVRVVPHLPITDP